MLTSFCERAAFVAEPPGALQTTARVWDALLNEGPKILFRVGLALMRIHEESLLAQDNPGTLLREMRRAAQAMHDREKLMKVSPPAAAVHTLAARVYHQNHDLDWPTVATAAACSSTGRDG